MKFRFRRVSTRIAVYAVLLLTVTCVGLSYLSYSQGSRAVMEEVERAIIPRCSEAAGYLESRLQVISNLETIAARPEMVWMDWGAQRLALRSEIERLSDFRRFGVAYPGGSIRYNDNTVSEAGDEPYIAAAFGGAAAVSDLLVDEETGEMTIVFAVPIISYDDVVGVLLGERGYDTLGDIVDHLAFGEQGWAYILNEQGTVMAHPNAIGARGISVFDQSSPLAPVGEALAQLDSTGDSVIRYQTGDGTRRIDGVTPISMTGWTLAVGAIESDVLGNIESLRTFMLGISILFIAFGVGASLFLGRQIARPLATVQRVMEDVAKGNFASRVQLNTKDEVGMVADSLNRTLDEVGQAIRGVADATNDLARMSREMAATSEEVSASVEQIASTTNEFSSTIEQVHNRAMGVRERAQQISSEAVRGEGALGAIITQLGSVREDTHALSNNINQLDSLSSEIGSIVSTITAISDQTDLLAQCRHRSGPRENTAGVCGGGGGSEVREQTSQAAAEIEN